MDSPPSSSPSAATPPDVADPVCGKRVQPGKTLWFIHHGDRTFYMCSLSCALRFQASPDAFAAAAGTVAGRADAAADER